MRFGICTTPDKVAKLKPGTLDYMEMNLSKVQAMSDEELKNTKDLLLSIGTPAEATNGFFPEEVRLCGSSYDPAKVAEYTKRALHNAAYLGIFTCVLGSSKARNIAEGDDRESCLKQFEEAIVVAGDVAKTTGTTIVLEPLRAFEANYLNRVSEGAEICRRVAHPNILLLADYFHVMDAKEDLQVLVDNADLLRHLHIASPDRKYPLPGDGHDYGPLANALKKAGYNGRMSIEGGCPGDFVPCTEEAMVYLRSVFA